MKYLGVLLLGMLLGALVYREMAVRHSPVLAAPSDCPSACPASTPAATSNKPDPAPVPPRVVSAPENADSQAVPAVTPSTETSRGGDSAAVNEADPLPAGLLIPVQGKSAAELTDTFTDARSQGRSHDAIDIMAAAGTPVLAVADGHVEKLFDSQRGGLAVYQFEPTGKYAYYYAHLQRYADGLSEKQLIRRGQVIGYVGSTGNADPAAPHLHFAIFLLGPERRWWKGIAINPYPPLSLKDKAA